MTETTADIETLVLRHQDGLRRYLMVLGCSEECADDLAQDAFLVLLRKSPALEEGAATSAWLRRCALNLLRESRRRESLHAMMRRKAAEELWSRYRLDERPNAWRDALVECLERVPQPMMETIDMHYRQGLTGKEISRATSRSESDVWMLLHRARKRLRACIRGKLDHDK